VQKFRNDSSFLYLLGYQVNWAPGPIFDVIEKLTIVKKFYIHCSVHHYNCSKIITNKMTLMDYPLFQG